MGLLQSSALPLGYPAIIRTRTKRHVRLYRKTLLASFSANVLLLHAIAVDPPIIRGTRNAVRSFAYPMAPRGVSVGILRQVSTCHGFPRNNLHHRCPSGVVAALNYFALNFNQSLEVESGKLLANCCAFSRPTDDESTPRTSNPKEAK